MKRAALDIGMILFGTMAYLMLGVALASGG
jgi:hypothetical protein